MEGFSFSLLLSLYNKEKEEYLEFALESIRNQTVLPNEIIIVFDGTINESLERIVTNFQEYLPIHIIRLDENVGLGMALNEGLKHCSNEWVFRMDTDDYSTPDRFEKQIQFILQNKDIVLLGTQMGEFNNEIGDIGIIREVPTTHNQIKNFATKRNPFNHISIAFRKSIIEQVGGYQHHLYMEDYNLWLRVLAGEYKTANLPYTLVYARIGNNMISRRKGVIYIKSEWQLFNLKLDLKLQKYFPALKTFLLRSIIRILPTNLLSLCYKLVRKLEN